MNQVDDKIVDVAGLFVVFHGVDTVADIVLNGQVLGRTENMFVRYRFHVGGLIKVL